MENVSIGQYRSHDSPKNFVIKVTFWKVTPGSVVPTLKFRTQSKDDVDEDSYELTEKRDDEDEKEELSIHWQEKFFSAKEFDFFSDPLNCTSSLEKKYYEDIQSLKCSKGDRPNSRVFTYVDSDPATAIEEFNKITLGDNDIPNILENKMAQNKYSSVGKQPLMTNLSGLKRRNIVYNEPSLAVKANHVISTPIRKMKIMADVGFKNSYGIYHDDERTLCTIKINANGLIVIQPDINTDEDFTIETYRETRSIYKYKFEDASERIEKHEMEQEARLFSELYTRHAQFMASHVGNEMYPLPAINELFLHSFCEIVSAKNFEYDSLYVSYYLDLPDGWQSNSCQLNGVTQRCTMNNNGIAHFSYPFEFQLNYLWSDHTTDEFLKFPTLYLQVFSLDSWQRHRIEGYGYCQLPDVACSTCVEIDMWRPKGDTSFHEMTRFFIGGTPELQDITFAKDLDNGVVGDKLNKFYFKTVTTGTITLKLNTLLQTKSDSQSGTTTERISKWRKSFKRPSGFSTDPDSFDQVLDAFQRARKRMLDAKKALPSISSD